MQISENAMKIESKNIVITGGTSGIGLELVRQLNDHNTVLVIARRSQALQEFRKSFPQVTVYEADLSDLDSLERAADQIVKSGVRIDILINNAAVQHTPHFLDDDFSSETIAREVTVNFTAPCALIYSCLPALLKDDPSIILNINSGLGLVPKTSSAVYCGTKGALDIFSQSLRHQLEHTNIRVMQAFLPMVETNMTRGRGTGKLTAAEAAGKIIVGLSTSKRDIDIGKVKILRFLNRISPTLASNIMKKA